MTFFCQDGQTHNAQFHVTEVLSRKLSECTFYKFQWRALHLTNFRKKYFPKQEEIRLQNAETCVVPKDVGEENNSNNYESHKN